MINLLDWTITHKIIRKSKKQFIYRLFFTHGRYPFHDALQDPSVRSCLNEERFTSGANQQAVGIGCSREAHFVRGLNCHVLKQQLGGIVKCPLYVMKDMFLVHHEKKINEKIFF